jgi:hypothetical protein
LTRLILWIKLVIGVQYFMQLRGLQIVKALIKKVDVNPAAGIDIPFARDGIPNLA